MLCEKCRAEMKWGIKGTIQGFICPVCGWNIITTYINEIYTDETLYRLYIKNVSVINREKIKFVAKTANVSYVIAKQMLEEKAAFILKAKAPEIKAAISKLQNLDIDFQVSPIFKYGNVE